MKLITPPHKKIAQKIDIKDKEKLKLILLEAKELIKRTINNEFFVSGSRHTVVFAMAHPQISEKPQRYFVINPKFRKIVEELKSEIIINPRIVSKDKTTRKMVKEACMSFPFRPMKKVKRFLKIEVKYYIIEERDNKLTVKEIIKKVEDLTAIIFQHELQHLNGKNIYQK